jgi:hypothetical protein
MGVISLGNLPKPFFLFRRGAPSSAFSPLLWKNGQHYRENERQKHYVHPKSNVCQHPKMNAGKRNRGSTQEKGFAPFGTLGHQ